MPDNTLFQYCQKLVVISADKSRVLLAKRKGEADYDGTFTFIGGKMETSDNTIIDGMKREKDEEIGSSVKIKVAPNETYNVLFRKQDGNTMIVPHIAAVFISGNIRLSQEYSEFQWVPITSLESFKPKVDNIPMLTNWALEKLSDSRIKLVEI